MRSDNMKGQVSLDLLLALVLFLVTVAFLINYINDFSSTNDKYISNISEFDSYIDSYDFINSTNKSFFSTSIIFDEVILVNNNKIIIDENNNYVINADTYVCEDKRCDKK